MKLLLVFLASYLLGSIPFGYIIAKKFKGVDIRNHGSGNTGATNVFRVLGSKAGLATAIGDVGKGIVAIIIARVLINQTTWGMTEETVNLITAILVIGGHNWPVFLKFNGGKGVATTAGVFLALFPYLFPILVLVWLPIVFLTKYVSLASMAAGIAIPILMILFNEPLPYLFFGIIAAIFVLYRHRSNIKRLLKGEENKINFPSKEKRVR